jgi:cyclophilin family peptidyl-prolyl cis-trans isomerase
MGNTTAPARRLNYGFMNRSLAILVLFVLVAAAALGQTYRPQPGETVMRVDVEGRGSIFIRLATKEAPRTTAHIQRLARGGFYEGQRFHRVERSPRPYLIQMGDPGSRTKQMDDPTLGTGGSGGAIPYENSGLPNVEGAVGLARPLGDKAGGDSQFYILLADSKFLDGSYTVFGQVVAGMDVVKNVRRGDRVSSVSIIGG